MKKDQLRKLLNHRVRLLPHVLRRDAAGVFCRFDDDWSIEEVTGEYIRLSNTVTCHQPLLGLDQIHSYTSDPQRNEYGFKYGFLRLHVQLTIDGTDTRIDLLELPNRASELRRQALSSISSNLEHGLFYLQRAASPAKLQGEANDQELLRRMAVNLGAASEIFSRNKLLIDPNLIQMLDQFFHGAFSAAQKLQLAEHPMTPNGYVRAGFFDEARAIAFHELPPLLKGIETEGRTAIGN